MPDSHAQTGDGLLLIFNGIDAPLVWDGLGEVQPAGLQPPSAPLIFGGAGPGTGGAVGTYYAYYRYLDARGNVSNLSPLAGPVTLAGEQVLYANVAPPLNPPQEKVVRKQILRNTSGQTNVFYVDVDTTNLTQTSFTSTLTDTQLSGQPFQAILDDKFNLLANANTPPPDYKSVVAHHLDRMFAACEVEYSQGSVGVTQGSTQVSGVGTEWPQNFAGRFLYVDGATQSYQIGSVNPVLQTVTLLSGYSGASNPYATYTIRPAPAQRRTIYYSLAGRPEAWPVTQALSLQEDGDELTGLMVFRSFIYFVERRHIYRFTFQDDPATDGFIFQSAGRGCVNNRSWVVVDQRAYLLDEAGIYSFQGGADVQPLSMAIQDLFEPEGQDSQYKINWSARSNFHASYHPGQNVVRWFVSLSGSDFPRHALCLELSQTRWWIEEYPVPIGASCLGRFLGEPRVFLGGPSGQVYLFGEGTLDRARPTSDSLRGSVSSAGPITLTDVTASFTGDLVGTPLVLVSGRGAGQRRIVGNVAGGTLTLNQPWLILPDTTSTYQLGGIQWRWKSKIWRWHDSEQEIARRLELLYEPCLTPAQVEARLFFDRSSQPVVFANTVAGKDYGGFDSQAGDPALRGDLTRPIGYAQRRLDGFRELYADGPRFVEMQLSGVTNQDQVRIYQMGLDGAR